MSASILENDPVSICNAFNNAKGILCRECDYQDTIFSDVNLCLVLDPTKTVTIPEGIEHITGGEYFNITCSNLHEEEEEENLHEEKEEENLHEQKKCIGWAEFGRKGYCTYDKNAVYIGYPYENQDIPLKRAIIHELGHHVQKKQGYVYIPNDNTFNTILEYHNIMFHENLSDCQGTYYKLYVIGGEFNGKRYNYSRSECLGYKEDLATMRNTKKLSKLGLLTTSLDELKRKLSKEFSGNALLGQMLDVTTEEMSLNHVLLFNCYRELRNIK